jgi:hypothetical protein
MQHMRAPPTGFRFYAIKTKATVTMKGQHTGHGVLPSLFSLDLESEIYQHDTRYHHPFQTRWRTKKLRRAESAFASSPGAAYLVKVARRQASPHSLQGGG